MPRFDVVRRGYDRDQVDAEIAALRERCAAAEAARAVAEQHAAATEEELRAARTEPAPVTESFGFRAEKILRLAEHEAADIRARANEEAEALLQRVHDDAGRLHDEVRRELETRMHELEQEATRRESVLQEREQQVAERLAVVAEEAAHMREAARQEADGLLTDAREHLARRREHDERDLRRLTALRDAVRTEMARLHQLLGAGLEDRTEAIEGAPHQRRADIPAPRPIPGPMSVEPAPSGPEAHPHAPTSAVGIPAAGTPDVERARSGPAGPGGRHADSVPANV
ncbi:hypothetical protein [Pseudonocardia acidicola]|uniref:Cellulose-binding protein n=1 Tax=Pseudonocardia acidicola TaxID=2724939 RepID=A0ABX1SDE6_9PSEU|nr:hypothetical protein [Pseudonocardia acidicola]NMH99594.1 hypothetical protein [Pseudonocardia acidicola]